MVGVSDMVVPKKKNVSLLSIRVLSSLFSLNLVLSLMLLFVPYSLYKAYGTYVYGPTHTYGLEPQDWFPFAWEGFGGFLYELSLTVWRFAAFGVIPLITVQFVMLYRHWVGLIRVERILHPTLLIVAIVLCLYMLTGGQDIIYWLLD